MIVKYVCRTPIYWPYSVHRHLACRKRCCVASWYSRGWSYMLLFLVYGNCLLTSANGVVTLSATVAAGRGSGGGFENAISSTPLTVVATIPKTDAMLGAPAVASNDKIDDELYNDYADEDEPLVGGVAANGTVIGAHCEHKCVPTLHHVVCDSKSNTCVCDKKYPVIIGQTQCAKARKLGEQCLHDLVCQHYDQNAMCIQVRHNALCQCRSDYHSVSYLKPTKRIFCTQDIASLTSDLPTLLGVTTGIAVLAGLICMVLHLFSKYPRHRNFGDASLQPPIMYSTDTVHSARPSSRSSLHSSCSIGSFSQRRPSSAPATSKGILVSTSRSGSRRPSLASMQSTSSSIKSYSQVRFEKELQQKELRQEMKLRLTRLQQQQHYLQTKPHIIISDLQHGGAIPRTIAITTPSPITPSSTDELLPSVDEGQEPISTINVNASYNGPCSLANDCLLD